MCIVRDFVCHNSEGKQCNECNQSFHFNSNEVK